MNNAPPAKGQQKAARALASEREWLLSEIAQLRHQEKQLLERLGKRPVVEVTLHDGQRVKARESDEYAERSLDHVHRLLGELGEKLRLIEYVLHPPRGRPRESAYDRAERDLAINTALTKSELARKHLAPIDSADMETLKKRMEQGLRRRKKKRNK